MTEVHVHELDWSRIDCSHIEKQVTSTVVGASTATVATPCDNDGGGGGGEGGGGVPGKRVSAAHVS